MSESAYKLEKRVDSGSSNAETKRWLQLILAAALLLCAFLWVDADFPSRCRWDNDWAKFTDEGWYATGAINRILIGHWVRPMDFNPYVTVPVWSWLLFPVFELFGVSISAARSMEVVFFCAYVAVASYIFWPYSKKGGVQLALVLAASPLLFFFSRLALLESPLLFFFCSALAVVAGMRTESESNSKRTMVSVARLVAAGILLSAAVLTKTSALFLVPALSYLVWIQDPHNSKRWYFLAIPIATMAVVCITYFFLAVHPNEPDFLLMVKLNPSRLSLRSPRNALAIIARGVIYTDPLLTPAALLIILASLKWLRGLWLKPLFGCSIIWCFGQLLFLTIHAGGDQPHYLVVMVVPLMMILLLGLQEVNGLYPGLAKYSRILVPLAIVCNLFYVGKLMMHRDYSMESAGKKIEAEIRSHPETHSLVIGHGASETTFFTSISAIDDASTVALGEKLDRYDPGWIVSWANDLSFASAPAIRSRYDVTFVKSYSVLDGMFRSPLSLFRLSKHRNGITTPNPQ